MLFDSACNGGLFFLLELRSCINLQRLYVVVLASLGNCKSKSGTRFKRKLRFGHGACFTSRGRLVVVVVVGEKPVNGPEHMQDGGQRILLWRHRQNEEALLALAFPQRGLPAQQQDSPPALLVRIQHHHEKAALDNFFDFLHQHHQN